MLNIAIGSTSKLKTDALTTALDELGIPARILGVKAFSGQNAQPVNFQGIMGGAIMRAEGAKKDRPDYFGLGIENGVLRFDAPEPGQWKMTFIDIAGVALITPEGRLILGTSSGIEFPLRYVQAAATAGFNRTTVGSIIAKELGGSPDDPHFTLTGGRLGREEILKLAIMGVLQQL